MASELVAVPKEIERAGKTFVQKYWMKLDAVAALIKKEGYNGAAAKLGADPKVVRGIATGWASSSSSDTSVETMAEIAKLVGYKPEHAPIRAVKGGVFDAQMATTNTSKQKALMALHALTQAGLQNEPDVVRVMRGVGGEFATRIRDHAIGLAEAGVPIEEAMLHIDFNPLSSFTSSKTIADGFGGGKIVFNLDVPKSSVLLSHVNSPGLSESYKREREYAVMSAGPTPVKIADLTGEHANAIRAAFKANEGKTAGYKAMVAAGEIEPGTALSLSLEKKTMTTAPVPAQTPKPVPVSLIIPTPSGVSQNAVEMHLSAAGATQVTSPMSGASSVATVMSDKIDDFSKKFAATPVFDSNKHTAASLAKYMQSKAAAAQSNISVGTVATSSTKLDPEEVKAKLKSLKGSPVNAGGAQGFIQKARKEKSLKEALNGDAPAAFVAAESPVQLVSKLDIAKANLQVALAEAQIPGAHPGLAHNTMYEWHIKASMAPGVSETMAKAHVGAASLHDAAGNATFQAEMTPELKTQSQAALAASKFLLDLQPTATKTMGELVPPPAADWSINGHEMSVTSNAPAPPTLKEKKAAPPGDYKNLTVGEKEVLHLALEHAQDFSPANYFGKSADIHANIASVTKSSMGGIVASLQKKGILHITDGVGKKGNITTAGEFHVLHPKEAKEATKDLRSKGKKSPAAAMQKKDKVINDWTINGAPMGSSSATAEDYEKHQALVIPSSPDAVDWKTHPHKAAALKALGYQPNKKELHPAEEKAVNTALAAYESAKKSYPSGTDPHAMVHGITKEVMESSGVKGSTKWADADAAADKLMTSLSDDPEPTKHTPASAKVAKDLEGEAAPYRSFWASFAKQGVKKGTPEGKVLAAFEKSQADTKVLMAKAHLKKQKLSNYAIYSLLKKQMAKHL